MRMNSRISSHGHLIECQKNPRNRKLSNGQKHQRESNQSVRLPMKNSRPNIRCKSTNKRNVMPKLLSTWNSSASGQTYKNWSKLSTTPSKKTRSRSSNKSRLTKKMNRQSSKTIHLKSLLPSRFCLTISSAKSIVNLWSCSVCKKVSWPRAKLKNPTSLPSRKRMKKISITYTTTHYSKLLTMPWTKSDRTGQKGSRCHGAATHGLSSGSRRLSKLEKSSKKPRKKSY